MKVLVQKNYEELSKKAAEIIKAQLAEKPDSVFGLATGGTPGGTYEEIIRMYKAGEVDFSRATAFNLDEYYPIKKTSDQSYYYFMQKNLFDHVNFAKTFIPNGEAADAATECAAYDEKIAAHGGIDLQILGIGGNGHIGFNEPGDEFIAATHHTPLDESTIKANARFFADVSEVPRHSLTMGIGTIMQAKKIILLASGAGKADIIQKTVRGAITPQVPASVLQLHPNVTIIADTEAGKLV
ncbi:MAG: glucosamine-6-phosphate deaminase [Defluviitaleaceae bacterium]|nr:glucosamine-6-phosphate deaminase [Defluviitaleaceae bacterium]